MQVAPSVGHAKLEPMKIALHVGQIWNQYADGAFQMNAICQWACELMDEEGTITYFQIFTSFWENLLFAKVKSKPALSYTLTLFHSSIFLEHFLLCFRILQLSPAFHAFHGRCVVDPFSSMDPPARSRSMVGEKRVKSKGKKMRKRSKWEKENFQNPFFSVG